MKRPLAAVSGMARSIRIEHTPCQTPRIDCGQSIGPAQPIHISTLELHFLYDLHHPQLPLVSPLFPLSTILPFASSIYHDAHHSSTSILLRGPHRCSRGLRLRRGVRPHVPSHILQTTAYAGSVDLCLRNGTTIDKLSPSRTLTPRALLHHGVWHEWSVGHNLVHERTNIDAHVSLPTEDFFVWRVRVLETIRVNA